MKEILQKALLEIKPEKDDVLEVEEFLKKLNAEIKKQRIKAKAVAGGSYAKNTWLSGDYDVDIFVKFDMKYASWDLSKLLGKILKKFKPITLHGSRDYYWVKNKLKFEIVPVLDIRKMSEAQNVTDFSPMHVKWVNTAGKKYKNDIRLAKRFCKVAGCYGAESYIRGFSGHVVDILVIYHKGFIPLLKASLKWKPKVIIDYNGKIGKKAVFVLNKSKIQGPMIAIDPVQPERNAAAALNMKMFETFKENAFKFLKKPSIQFFEYSKIDYNKLKKKGKLIVIDVDVPKGKEDPIGAKLLKAFEFIKKRLEGFEVKLQGWQWDKGKKAEFWYVLCKDKLPETFEIIGPPAEIKEHAKKFKKKYKKTHVKKGRVCSKAKHKYRKIEELLRKEILKHEYLKDKVKNCKIVSKFS
ncbi:nucleotidyltransferase domain-containing protein [Candidatus Woesearchaeota archaeon]|nr:nucleotidyltransferase domain-containing protein [Candidatus Woesearchaeota archaeon]